MKWVPIPYCGSRMGLGFRDAKNSFGCLGVREGRLGGLETMVTRHANVGMGLRQQTVNRRVLSPVVAWHVYAACRSPFPSLVDVLDSHFIHCC